MISLNCRPDLLNDSDCEGPWTEDLGVKNRVNRFGVIGGGFLGFLLPVLDGGPNGDDGGIFDIGSCEPYW